MSATRPRVVVVTMIASPYQVELFDALEAAARLDFSAIYTQRDMGGRRWRTPQPRHRHGFADTPDGRADARREVAAADLVVFSGYLGAAFASLIRRRARAGGATAFWGERPGFHLPGFIGRIGRAIAQRRLRACSAAVWGIGEWAVEGYRREFGDRLFLNVPYFRDLSRYLAIPRDATREGPTRFLFSGELSRRKGVDRLAEAFLELSRAGVEARLSLLGDGEWRADLQRRLAPLGDRVAFLGFRQWSELPDLYASHDALCAPSRHDGWGLIVPEGLAAGMPVIATSAMGAARDLVDVANGWICPPDDSAALAEAMAACAALDGPARRAMIVAGREAARRVDLPAGVERFHDAVERTLVHAARGR